MSADRKDYPDIVKLQPSLFVNINSTINFSNLKVYLQIFQKMIYGSFENFDCILTIFIPNPFQIHPIPRPHDFVFLKSPLVPPILPYVCDHPLDHGWSCLSQVRKTQIFIIQRDFSSYYVLFENLNVRLNYPNSVYKFIHFISRDKNWQEN